MSEGTPKNLYFFTDTYPYRGEAFVGNEIRALAPFYTKIVLISTIKEKEVKETLPANVELIYLDENVKGKASLFFSNIFLIGHIFFLDLIHNTDRRNVFKDFRYNLSLLLKVLYQNKTLEKIIKNDKSAKSFVSFWMDQWALSLAMLKRKKVIKSFVFRVHQHDLYIDENPQRYIPFRYFNIKMANAVFPDAKRGVKYLKDLNYYPEKIQLGHLGVVDKGTNPFPEKEFVIVSCSTLIYRKRVDLIPDVLELISEPITWIHFGALGQTSDAFEKLRKRCESLPKNIKVILKGDVSYSELINFYTKNPISLFITLTRAEGLPVSVIEATSFGIPVLATDIMGLPDVVTEETGILIPHDMERKKIAEEIKQFMNGSKNTPVFRERVKKFWRENFSSEINYSKFDSFLNTIR